MIVYVLLDAFRSDYINKENTPFLYDLTKQKNVFYSKEVVPSFSFCERIEIFSGVNVEESLFFTAIGRDMKSSNYKKLKYYFLILHYIDISLVSINYNLKKLFRKIFTKIHQQLGLKLKLYNIPLNIISNYRLTEDNMDIRSYDFEKNIFKKIKKHKLKILYNQTFTSLTTKYNLNDDQRLQTSINSKNDDIQFIYIGLPDESGHRFGPSSVKFKKNISELDTKIENYINTINSNSKNTIILNGDHGMRDVKFNFNIEKHLIKILKNKKLYKNKDYEIFLDSTILRLWRCTDFDLNILTEDILLNELGTFVSISNDKAFTDLYGELIWNINQGGLILPNYFQQNTVKGMHGYIPTGSEDFGTLIVINPTQDYSKLSKQETKGNQYNANTPYFCSLFIPSIF